MKKVINKIIFNRCVHRLFFLIKLKFGHYSFFTMFQQNSPSVRAALSNLKCEKQLQLNPAYKLQVKKMKYRYVYIPDITRCRQKHQSTMKRHLKVKFPRFMNFLVLVPVHLRIDCLEILHR